mmetsp:Transcript_11620/g.26271  ORF Transcript_11620/g.26271 Transcript_11620/m.26271 type:complete len:293 (-) Transcript_11620:1772-2650(-)
MEDAYQLGQIEGLIPILEACISHGLLHGFIIWQVAKSEEECFQLCCIKLSTAIRIILLHDPSHMSDLLLLDTSHAHEELPLVDLATAILVNFGDDSLDLISIDAVAKPLENGCQLSGIDLTRRVSIETHKDIHEVAELLSGETLVRTELHHDRFEAFEVDLVGLILCNFCYDLSKHMLQRLNAKALQKLRQLMDIHEARTICVGNDEGLLESHALPVGVVHHKTQELINPQSREVAHLLKDFIYPTCVWNQANSLHYLEEVIPVNLIILLELVEGLYPEPVLIRELFSILFT